MQPLTWDWTSAIPGAAFAAVQMFISRSCGTEPWSSEYKMFLMPPSCFLAFPKVHFVHSVQQVFTHWRPKGRQKNFQLQIFHVVTAPKYDQAGEIMIQLRPMVRIQDLHPKTHDLRISLVIEKKKRWNLLLTGCLHLVKASEPMGNYSDIYPRSQVRVAKSHLPPTPIKQHIHNRHHDNDPSHLLLNWLQAWS